MITSYTIRTFVLSLSLMLVAAAAACTGDGASADQPATSRLTREQATEMLDNALLAFNSGDYAAWSRDWSDPMKRAINADTFAQFRDQQMGRTGEYVSISGVELVRGRSAGFIRWVATAQFEKATVSFAFGMAEDGMEVEGAFFDIAS